MKDILIDENYQVACANGDFVTGDSDLQQQQLLLLADKGDWKQFPTVGVGVRRYLKSDEPETLLAEIKKEYQRDGMKVKEVELLGDGTLNVDASY